MKISARSFLACSLALGIGCSDDGAPMAASTGGDDGGGTNITGLPPPTTSPPPTGGADGSGGDGVDDGGTGTPTDDTGPLDPDASTGPGLTDDGTTAEPPATDSGSTTGEPATDDTVYEVQDGTIPPKSMVAIENVIVTGVGAAGVFVQEPAGGEYSGVWVYSNAGGGGPDLSVLGLGDEINITGVTAEYFDRTEIEISDGELVVVAKGGPVPTPQTLAADVFGNAA